MAEQITPEPAPWYLTPSNGYSSFSAFLNQSFSTKQVNYGGPLFYSGSSVFGLGVVGVLPSIMVFSTLANSINDLKEKFSALDNDVKSLNKKPPKTNPLRVQGILTTGLGLNITVATGERLGKIDIDKFLYAYFPAKPNNPPIASATAGEQLYTTLVSGTYLGTSLQFSYLYPPKFNEEIKALDDQLAQKDAKTQASEKADFNSDYNQQRAILFNQYPRNSVLKVAQGSLIYREGASSPEDRPLLYAGQSYVLSYTIQSNLITYTDLILGAYEGRKEEDISPLACFKQDQLSYSNLIKISGFSEFIEGLKGAGDSKNPLQPSGIKRIPLAIITIPPSSRQKQFLNIATKKTDTDYPIAPTIIDLKEVYAIAQIAYDDSKKIAEAQAYEADRALREWSASSATDEVTETLTYDAASTVSIVQFSGPVNFIDFSSINITATPSPNATTTTPSTNTTTTTPSTNATTATPSTDTKTIEPLLLRKGIDYTIKIPEGLENFVSSSFEITLRRNDLFEPSKYNSLEVKYKIPNLNSTWDRISLTTFTPIAHIQAVLVDIKAKALSATLPSSPYKEGSLAQQLENIINLLLKIIDIVLEFLRLIDLIIDILKTLASILDTLSTVNIYVLVVGLGGQAASDTAELKALFTQAQGIPQSEDLYYAAGIAVFGVPNPSSALEAVKRGYGLNESAATPSEWMANVAKATSSFSPATTAPLLDLISFLAPVLDTLKR